MWMQSESLIVVNQRVERERHAQLFTKCASELMQAQQERLPLKQQYLISIENMKLQLHALKLSIGAQSCVIKKCKGEVAQPKLVSESSSDSESQPSDTDISSSEGATVAVSAYADPRASMRFSRPESSRNSQLLRRSVSYSDPRTSTRFSRPSLPPRAFSRPESSRNSQQLRQTNKQCLEERNRQLVGKTVEGRFKVYTPQSSGAANTRYYLNWSTVKNNNIHLSAAVLEKFIGLDNIQPGALIRATIVGLGPDYVRWDKQHPFTHKVSLVDRAPRHHWAGPTRRPRAYTAPVPRRLGRSLSLPVRRSSESYFSEG
jgi:hypothetical protein